MGAVVKMKVAVGDTSLTVSGREAWMLDRLVNAGAGGVSPLDGTPAMRLAHYVYKLRGAGLSIETVHEKHGGAYSGTHARYVLRTPLTVIETSEAA